MIVIINSIAIPLSARIAEHLTRRYPMGGRIDLHDAEISAGRPRSFDMMLRLIPPEQVGSQVAANKQEGRVHSVLTGTFAIPQDLRQLRCFLSAYDDEIYAFRLPIVLSIRTHISGWENPEYFAAMYTRWEDAQEAGVRSGDMGYEIPISSSDPVATADRIWDDIHAPVELVEFRPEWPLMFAREKSQLLQVLPDVIVAIEHIGSTAIPGMPAKPIIDILITVKELEDTVACIQPLRELGYAFIDYPQNTDRRFFRKGTPRSYHIHIVRDGHPSAHAYIRFRDALLSDSDLRQEYQQLKYASIQQFKYRRALYGEQKSVLIRKALER